MAPKSKDDCTQEILELRHVLSVILSQIIYDLDKELDRIRLIIKPKEETKTSESEPREQVTSTSTSELKGIGHIDLTQFVPKNAKKRERIKDGVKVSFPSLYLSPKEAAECYPERKALIESFLRRASVDSQYVQELFLLRSMLRFIVMKKEISYLRCDYQVIHPYTGSLLSPYEIADFLVFFKWREPRLTRDLLTILSQKYGTLSIIHAVCDNAYDYRNDDERKQAESLIVDMVLGLGDSQVDFSKDIRAYQNALDNYVLRNLHSYLSVAKSVTEDSLSRIKFPLNDDRIEGLEFAYDEFYTYPEGKDEYKNVLERVLNDALEEGYISPLEHAAIIGEGNTLSGRATVADYPTKWAVPLSDNPQSAANKVLVSQEETLPDSPQRFINNKAAFIRLYENLVQDEDLPREMDPDNWCKLFKLEMRDNSPIYKLEWQKSKTALRCFLEELYKPSEMPSELNSIFILPRSRRRLKLSEITFSSKKKEQEYRDKFNRFVDDALGVRQS